MTKGVAQSRPFFHLAFLGFPCGLDRVHIHAGETQFIDHGSAHDALLQIGPSEVVVEKNEEIVERHHGLKWLLKAVVLGPERAVRSINKGALTALPNQQALPKPDAGGPSVPTPALLPSFQKRAK
jgi:hypothetical protein